MKVKIVNTSFGEDNDDMARLYSRIIEGPDNMTVPRVGDRVHVGYVPAPIVRNVTWFVDKKEVLVEIS